MEKNQLQSIVGRNLQRCRANIGLTQEQIAEQAGISTSFYANLERGTRCMSALVLRALADTLGVGADSLLYEDDTNPHIENICALLSGQPAWFAQAVETTVRIWVGILLSQNASQEQDVSGGEANAYRQIPRGTD